MFSLEALFCHVDDFCKTFEAQWHKTHLPHPQVSQRENTERKKEVRIKTNI
jgi:hypothetical protein